MKKAIVIGSFLAFVVTAKVVVDLRNAVIHLFPIPPNAIISDLLLTTIALALGVAMGTVIQALRERLVHSPRPGRALRRSGSRRPARVRPLPSRWEPGPNAYWAQQPDSNRQAAYPNSWMVAPEAFEEDAGDEDSLFTGADWGWRQ